MDTKHLNQTELSRRWGLSPRTLERWRWAGCGPAFLKVGGSVRYRLEDVEEFEESGLRRIDGTVSLGSRSR
jgi:hypothetical protein